MIASHGVVDDVIAVVVAILVFVPAFIIAISQTRKVGKKVDTGNGRTIGSTVHDTAQTVELVEAMMHTNTREIIMVANKLDAHIVESKEVHAKLLAALGIEDRRKGEGSDVQP